MKAILEKGTAEGASDIHLKAGLAPMHVKNGKVASLGIGEALSNEEVRDLLFSVLSPKQIHEFDESQELDTSFDLPNIARFRLNMYHANATTGAVIRVIPPSIRSVEELGLPPAVKRLAFERQGLILVTGPTGSGKTTSLAALIDYINSNKAGHIVTVEDPIEVVHPHKNCLITQREIGTDTPSFSIALRAALRQAPNIILVGEMRDQETISMALKAAETGHLVFSTLHTNDAVQTINRVINAFPPHEQEPIRIQLANSIKGCIAQRLVPRADRAGRIAAIELLVVTGTARDAILKNEIEQIYELIRGGAYDGMQSMNMSLLGFFKNGVIDYETSIGYSENAAEMTQMLRNALRDPVKT
ncbi:MAG TPA: type IV pili twitching motility protein PilT [Cyanobacteria bacterium UBA8530]|nr:type IV pili twitching motility protein PilT [Cyanobacteria bacterium UBA8530]